MGIFTLTGTADATGEKTRFQAKKSFFPSGVLFFSFVIQAVFPLKISKTPVRITPQAIHSPPETASEANTTPRKSAISGFTNA